MSTPQWIGGVAAPAATAASSPLRHPPLARLQVPASGTSGSGNGQPDGDTGGGSSSTNGGGGGGDPTAAELADAFLLEAPTPTGGWSGGGFGGARSEGGGRGASRPLRLHCATFNLGGRPPPKLLPLALLGLDPEQRRAYAAADGGNDGSSGGGGAAASAAAFGQEGEGSAAGDAAATAAPAANNGGAAAEAAAATTQGLPDLLAFATQETASIPEWEAALRAALAPLGFGRLGSVSLRAISLSLWGRRGVRRRAARLRASSVATGIAGVVGNKGGVALSLELAGGGPRLLFVGAHFAAHDAFVARRNADFHAVRTGLFARGALLAPARSAAGNAPAPAPASPGPRGSPLRVTSAGGGLGVGSESGGGAAGRGSSGSESSSGGASRPGGLFRVGSALNLAIAAAAGRSISGGGGRSRSGSGPGGSGAPRGDSAPGVARSPSVGRAPAGLRLWMLRDRCRVAPMPGGDIAGSGSGGDRLGSELAVAPRAASCPPAAASPLAEEEEARGGWGLGPGPRGDDDEAGLAAAAAAAVVSSGRDSGAGTFTPVVAASDGGAAAASVSESGGAPREPLQRKASFLQRWAWRSGSGGDDGPAGAGAGNLDATELHDAVFWMGVRIVVLLLQLLR